MTDKTERDALVAELAAVAARANDKGGTALICESLVREAMQALAAPAEGGQGEAAEAKVADAEPRLAKVARGDAARINALQRHLWSVEPDYANDGWRVGKASKDGRPNHYGNSLRSAIDAAIAAQQAEGE